MKTRTALTALAAALATTGWALPASADARPMTAEDLVKFARIGAPSVSPDGSKALVRVSYAKDDMSGRRSAYYIHSMADGTQRHVPALDGAGGARYGGDGAIWFVRDDQVHRWVEGDGDATQVSNLSAGSIDDFVLSPDASNIVLLASRDLACEDFACANVEAADEIGNALEYDEIFVRQWDTWVTPGEKAQLYGFRIVDGQMAGNGAIVGRGLTGNTPSRPFGGSEEVAVSNDGIVYFAQREGGSAEPTSTNLDLYAAPIDGSAAPVNLTDANEAHDNLPSISPDGQWLAYAAMERPNYESDKMSVMLRDLATGETRALTADWDLSVGSIAWTPDGSSLIVGVGEVMEHPLYRIDVATGARQRLTRDGNAGNAVPLDDGRILFSMNNLAMPTELFLYAPEGGTVTQQSYFNSEMLKQLDPIEWEKFSFEGAEGDTVWGFRLKPSGATEDLPIAFVVHGGPQGSFGNSWSTRWNPRALSAGRYAVVSVDFHGSTGYGQDFTDSINQDWGGKPLEDLQKGLAYALDEYPELDGDRICALGASYGGYMMNWIAGNWPDRFDCLINHNGLFDMRGFYYATEELWFPRWDMGGSYAEAADMYEKWNPVNHVDKWQTPMLVVLGLKDYRVPYSQGLGAFTALQERDIPSKLLVFPEENHWVLDGANSVRWHNEVHEWMDRWTAEEAE
ncbi:alpha/beta hydrolase family protein [Sphingomicrobium clamense]|uniref:S9 family peptidase n=1 Tax=Sphingomicrobium clamense TaxID=2851013 RepID=A0ABS6V7K1_9SPHN|nr:S9 family peptidase [Sphingomicrobium sp. B8]MBW0145551.1 S9 family peptidase [Sphingomicrobium sp. B8]